MCSLCPWWPSVCGKNQRLGLFFALNLESEKRGAGCRVVKTITAFKNFAREKQKIARENGLRLYWFDNLMAFLMVVRK